MSADLSSEPCPSSLTGAEFNYEPLEYAAKEIRLVKIIRLTRQYLEIKLDKYHISDVPEYNAISYTWGDGETTCMTDIIVNGQKMKVTENCRCALEQAHSQQHLLQSSQVYFWIDSICVDQNSHMEKQHQVAMMGRIYAQAVRVLACVGCHQDNSHYFAEVLQKARNFCDNVAEEWKPLMRTYQDWFDEFDESTRASVEALIMSKNLERTAIVSWLPKALLDFSKRYYWTRLWIVQEVAVAKHLEVLCGSDRFSRSDIYLLHWIAGCCFYDTTWSDDDDDPTEPLLVLYGFYGTHAFPHFFSHFKFVLSRNSMDRIPALDILMLQDPFGCSRPEDRVYGMLSLLKWPEIDPPIQIQPVYRSSINFDLAELFLSLPNCRFENMQGIFQALEICHDLGKMKKLVASRLSSSSAHPERSRYPVCHYDLDMWAYEVITKSETNHLTASLGRRMEHTSHSPTMLSMIKNAPQLLYAESEVAALLCSAASEGDFIIQTPFGQCLLILRYTGNSNNYHIVGQGLLMQKFFVPGLSGFCHPVPNEIELMYSRYWFNCYLRDHASLLRESPDTYEKDLGLCVTHLKEIYNEELALLNQNCKDLSQPGIGKLDIIDALRVCAQEMEKLEDSIIGPGPRLSARRVPFALALEPLEMLLLGCQDLEKSGCRKEGKTMQRLNTAIYGTAFTRSISDDRVLTVGGSFFFRDSHLSQLLRQGVNSEL